MEINNRRKELLALLNSLCSTSNFATVECSCVECKETKKSARRELRIMASQQVAA